MKRNKTKGKSSGGKWGAGKVPVNSTNKRGSAKTGSYSGG